MTKEQLIIKCHEYLDCMGTLEFIDAFIDRSFIEGVLQELMTKND